MHPGRIRGSVKKKKKKTKHLEQNAKNITTTFRLGAFGKKTVKCQGCVPTPARRNGKISGR